MSGYFLFGIIRYLFHEFGELLLDNLEPRGICELR